MKKLMLVFPYRVRDGESFDEFINGFDSEDMFIHVFNEISPENFSLEILPIIIKDLEEQYGRFERIFVLSNIKEIIFSWYRCYNSLVDDFICYIEDNKHHLFEGNRNIYFLSHLYNFVGIEQELIQGEIFLNIHCDNYQDLFPFLVNNNHFCYFNSIVNLDLNNYKEKDKVQKRYRFDNQTYFFELNSHYSINNVTLYPVESGIETVLKLDDQLIKLLNENPFFIPYLIFELCKQHNSDSINFLISYLKDYFRKLSTEERAKIALELIKWIKKDTVSFYDKVYISSLLPLLQVNEGYILENIMKVLKDDYTYLDYHYPVLINMLFYMNRDNTLLYKNYHHDNREEITKISNYYMKTLNFGAQITRKNHVAIVVDQLLKKIHSPTKVIIDYALSLKKLNPNLQIEFFVEDNFVSCNNERIGPYSYSAAISSSLYSAHQLYLGNEDIKIFYSDPTMPKKVRTYKIIDEIWQFGPEVILSTSYISLAVNILYSYFPIVFFSHGAINYSSLADVYLNPNKDEVIKDNSLYNLIDTNRVYSFEYGVTFPKSDRQYKRMDFSFNSQDFIMVTVGNRLDAEMDPDFIDLIIKYLRKNANAKWLIVGKAQLSYIYNNFGELLNKQIYMAGFVADLPSLYNICDIYVNPVRKGGGMSIAMAMNEVLPVVVLAKVPSDGMENIGRQNCVNSFEEYFNELDRLYQDIDYRNKKGQLLKERLENQFSIKNSTEHLINYLELAKKSFLLRKGNQL